MKYCIALLLLISLTGCSTTVPVVAKFPEVPKLLLTKCPNLQELAADAKLSDVAKIVSSNYSSYYECAVKIDAWIEWYNVQKTIYEGIK
jgi:hypothetical protein